MLEIIAKSTLLNLGPGEELTTALEQKVVVSRSKSKIRDVDVARMMWRVHDMRIARSAGLASKAPVAEGRQIRCHGSPLIVAIDASSVPASDEIVEHSGPGIDKIVSIDLVNESTEAHVALGIKLHSDTTGELNTEK